MTDVETDAQVVREAMRDWIHEPMRRDAEAALDRILAEIEWLTRRRDAADEAGAQHVEQIYALQAELAQVKAERDALDRENQRLVKGRLDALNQPADNTRLREALERIRDLTPSGFAENVFVTPGLNNAASIARQALDRGTE